MEDVEAAEVDHLLAQVAVLVLAHAVGRERVDELGVVDQLEVEVQAGANLQEDIAKFFESTAESIDGQLAITIQRPAVPSQVVGNLKKP